MSILDQYKRAMTRTDIVGGPYNRPEAIVQRGFHPTVGPVFFDDGVRVFSGSDVNQYNAGVWSEGPVSSNMKVTSAGVVSNLFTIEMFLKFSRPVIEMAHLVVIIDGMFWRFTNVSTSETLAVPRGTLAINLIKVPMDLGETFGLDNLTGNNAAWVGNAQTHGTLYDTPANFEDFGGVGAEFWTITTSSAPSMLIGQTFVYQTFTSSQSLLFGPGANGGSVKNSGPYFGIHIFWRSANVSNDRLAEVSSGTIEAGYVVNMPTPRGGAGDTVRGFALDTSMYSFR